MADRANHRAMPEADAAQNPAPNVVPFRATEIRAPALSPVESRAFDELGRELSARLDQEGIVTDEGSASGTAFAPQITVPVPDGHDANLRRQGNLGYQELNEADLFSRIGGDILEPVTAIVGLAGRLSGHHGDAEKHSDHAAEIRRLGETILARLEGWIEVARMERGASSQISGPHDLNALVAASVAAVQTAALRSRIVIRVALGDALPPVVGDFAALAQLVNRLIHQAVEAAAAGHHIIASTSAGETQGVMLKLRVAGPATSTPALPAAPSPLSFATAAAIDSGKAGHALIHALAEMNGTTLAHRKAGPAGTLVEVTFPSVQRDSR